ncbi:MAG: hypothetical protein H6566_06020 [Lewinellaceae bacterium]|nr:hypothetical protein [Lewinellaceae bacterium]
MTRPPSSWLVRRDDDAAHNEDSAHGEGGDVELLQQAHGFLGVVHGIVEQDGGSSLRALEGFR